MENKPTVPLYAICHDTGPCLVVFDGCQSLPVFRTLLLAESFLGGIKSDKNLHIREFGRDGIPILLKTAAKTATHVLWNPEPKGAGVIQSDIQAVMRMYPS